MSEPQQCLYCKEDNRRCPVTFGTCHCGCGNEVVVVTSHNYYYGDLHVPQGHPCRWVRGHAQRSPNEKVATLRRRAKQHFEEGICYHCGIACRDFGRCHCGCEQKTSRAPWNRYAQGYVKGIPMKYIRGHLPHGAAPQVLRADDVREIRRRYAADAKLTQTVLAEEYGVSQQAISRILLGDSFKDVGA